jgi:hypothetical protein
MIEATWLSGTKLLFPLGLGAIWIETAPMDCMGGRKLGTEFEADGWWGGGTCSGGSGMRLGSSLSQEISFVSSTTPASPIKEEPNRRLPVSARQGIAIPSAATTPSDEQAILVAVGFEEKVKEPFSRFFMV